MPTELTDGLILEIVAILVNCQVAIDQRVGIQFQLGLSPAQRHSTRSENVTNFFQQTLVYYNNNGTSCQRPTVERIINALNHLGIFGCAESLSRLITPPIESILQECHGGSGITTNPGPMLELLRQLGDIEFMIISIIGARRKGKSFIMACIAAALSIASSNEPEYTDWLEEIRHNAADYFKWRQGTESETKGVNIFKRPIILRRRNGQRFGVILIDSQGEFDYGPSLGQDALYFAFCALISSVTMYNTVFYLNQNDLEPLRVFVNRATERFPPNGDNKLFQNFILLQRDVPGPASRLGFHTSTTTPQNATENLFQAVLGLDASLPDLISNFNSVGLYALPHPGLNLREDSLNGMEPIFKSKVGDFVRFIVSDSTAVLKEVDGSSITASAYAPIFEALCENFNAEEVLDIDGLFNSHQRQRLLTHLNRMTHSFNTRIPTVIANIQRDFPLSRFQQLFNQQVQLTIDEFNSMGNTFGDMYEEYRDLLTEQLVSTFENHQNAFKQTFYSYIRDIDVAQKELEKGRNILQGAREHLCTVNYLSHVSTNTHTESDGGFLNTGLFSSSSTYTTKEFQAGSYDNAIQPLNATVVRLQNEYLHDFSQFETLLRPYQGLDDLKRELKSTTQSFTSFQLQDYTCTQIDSTVRLFFVPPQNKTCTIYDTTRYNTETKTALDRLEATESRLVDLLVDKLLS